MSTAPFAYTAADDIAKEEGEGEEERPREEGAGGQCIDCGQANALLFGTYVHVTSISNVCHPYIYTRVYYTRTYIYTHTRIRTDGRRARMCKTTRGDRVPAYLSD